MKISCTKENLYKGLLITGYVTGRNTTLPILNNVLLKTEGGALTISSTNLEVGVVTIVRGKVGVEGSITIQGKLFTELVALLPNDRVDLELDNLDLKISCAGHQTVIHGLTAEDFPVIPEVAAKGNVVVDSQDLAEALNQVLIAVNPQEARPEISGVLINMVNDKKLALVATDSYRLAEKIILISKGQLGAGQLIIPVRTVQQLVRILNTHEETKEVEIRVGDNQVMWQIGESKIVSRIITAQFPDYQQIIPKTFNSELLVDRTSLLQAVKSASLFTRAGINDVRLQTEPSTKKLLVSSANSQLGEDSSTLTLIKATGSNNEIVFNYRYLIDGLNAISGKEVQLAIVDTNNPGLLKPASGDDYSYIIMPIRQ
ncbi:MAG: DNA polymerase III subunit beta [Patescibacteria group bacterium]